MIAAQFAIRQIAHTTPAPKLAAPDGLSARILPLFA
jgi:hypothetical protein